MQWKGRHARQGRDLRALGLRGHAHALPDAIEAPSMKGTLNAAVDDSSFRQVCPAVWAARAQGVCGAIRIPEQHHVAAQEFATERTGCHLTAPACAVPR